jgi:cell division control protein 6
MRKFGRYVLFTGSLCPQMSSSAIQRRSTRASVLGKRSHQSQVDAVPSPASNKSLSHDPLNDDDDASTVDLSPCAKRPRTSIAPADRNGNKENIPPLRIDCLEESSRALRRSSTEFITPTRTRMRMQLLLLSIYSLTSTIKLVRRHASTSNLASPQDRLSVSSLGLQTPPPTPCTSSPLHIRTRALLRATCDSSTELAGRIPERQFIRNFLTDFIKLRSVSEVTRPVLYISGSPGCGKTALVNSILATSEAELLANNINLVSVNCMALNGLEAVWDRLVEELGFSSKRRAKTRSCEVVENLLSNRTSKWSVSARCRMSSANMFLAVFLFLMKSIMWRLLHKCSRLYLPSHKSILQPYALSVLQTPTRLLPRSLLSLSIV